MLIFPPQFVQLLDPPKPRCFSVERISAAETPEAQNLQQVDHTPDASQTGMAFDGGGVLRYKCREQLAAWQSVSVPPVTVCPAQLTHSYPALTSLLLAMQILHWTKLVAGRVQGIVPSHCKKSICDFRMQYRGRLLLAALDVTVPPSISQYRARPLAYTRRLSDPWPR